LYSCYVEGILRHQPHGPYALLGFCFGGLLAFEVAKRLESRGEKVPFVSGIDNPPDLKHLRVGDSFRNLVGAILPEFGMPEDKVKLFVESQKDVSSLTLVNLQ
jgi:thioesterase domain-containing protein